MLPYTILLQNTNATPSSPITNISLTHFLEKTFQYPIQLSFHRRARIPSLFSNIFLWLAFLFAIIVLQIGKHELSSTIKIMYGSTMLLIIILCYGFILFESKGCIEQILLKHRLQIDLIKRELGSIQRNAKLTNYLTVTASNYYNSLQRKYVDYQLYDKSSCIRFQSFFYRNIRLIETPFNIRQYHIRIPDFSINENYLCQIFFTFNLSITGRDADIVHDDIKQEFQRLEIILFNSSDDNKTNLNIMNKFARIQRRIHFQFNDMKQQDLLLGQRRTCLIYENKTKIYYRWFLTENTFWIMTCIGLSWLYRAIFACLIRKINVPIHIELEGAMPLQSRVVNHKENKFKEKISQKT